MSAAAGTDTFAERFLHVDMDAFYVEVERLRDPSLRGVAVVVGGLGPRGVVAAASYEARARGVQSAMPMAEARRRVPRARFVPPDHRRYGEVSTEVFAVFRSFTPAVEGLSVDEAFLDVSGLRLHYPSPGAVAAAVRARLRNELDLPASVGVATTKFLAKLASEEAKPDGIHVVAAGDELAFLHPLPVRRLWGVGAATHAALEGMAISTVGDLAAHDPGALARRLGPALGAHLVALANGQDPREVETTRDAKSISVEETFPADLRDETAVAGALLRLCTRLADRLHRAELVGRTLTIKVRFGDFTTVTRSATAGAPLAHSTDLWDVSRLLLERAMRAGEGVRLLGVAVGRLEPPHAALQLQLEGDRRGEAADVAQEVRARFGSDALIPARLVRKPSTNAEDSPEQ